MISVPHKFTVRYATKDDADAIAAVFSPSLRLIECLPILYTAEEERWFIGNDILESYDVMVAEQGNAIVAFLAREGEEVRLLHTHPDHIGQGAGAQLLDNAKLKDLEFLELWCFQQNTLARRFYERHNFFAIKFSDGERNFEKTPDVLYRWEKNYSPASD